MPRIILLGTLDTKRAEILYIYNQLQHIATRFSTPLEITLIDCGRQAINDDAITISHTDLISKYASGDSTDLLTQPRGQVIELLISCVSKCVTELLRTTEVHGIIGAGGSGGTSLITAVMRNAAPLGLPKLVVSTVASGDTGPMVGECDITLMYSIVDIAGTNRLLREVLGNAAGAIFGMASTYQHRLDERRTRSLQDKQREEKKTRVGITMFGVTTPCVDRVRRHLEENYSVEVYVFHATGHGGKAMERLVEDGCLDAILDITTTEICDLIAGGTMSCETSRLEMTLKRGIPNIISIGATDMVNFGPVDTVPRQYRDRKLLVHNPSVTLMRTSAAECREVGDFLLDKLNRFAQDQSMVEVWLPRGGVSIIGTVGSEFADADADAALADTLRSGLKGSKIRVVSDERDINDDGFALDIADRLMALVAKHSCSVIAS
ncbi:hypothetical protein DTO006G1_6601 [Penicillium roqueforti]|uniref:uncharacterized protein n=1 Tax=Penicillium roqueforti TaxID=5082 RepID=UPI00190C9CA6|nr:uncharacterized protein LCP9604111_4161 [Penicillium roqueforti]KAF9249532.1 hypothetical protein LCP9604111_4161 [Penicillium roqueforti]KAI1835073.1 hypothetical protein CBS147337_3890 [Penicillium roqueforti]KAI2677086.1 hypothetical protein CBS147355_5313 [Penicillium roqueforti]KAI2688616.1 hypothetical protein LCP963914a_3018 [Penicillium roqueforti]KAI2700792.1 hypothetical protein CBS147372_5571 [Penicillium roqueforti]